MKQVIVRNLQALALAVLVGIATIVIVLGSLAVSEVARKVNAYEGRHRTSTLHESQPFARKVNEYEGQHRFV